MSVCETTFCYKYLVSFSQSLQVKEVGTNSGERLVLSQLRPQLVNLLTNALQVETDPANTQMLLGEAYPTLVNTVLCI